MTTRRAWTPAVLLVGLAVVGGCGPAVGESLGARDLTAAAGSAFSPSPSSGQPPIVRGDGRPTNLVTCTSGRSGVILAHRGGATAGPSVPETPAPSPGAAETPRGSGTAEQELRHTLETTNGEPNLAYTEVVRFEYWQTSRRSVRYLGFSAADQPILGVSVGRGGTGLWRMSSVEWCYLGSGPR